MSFQSRYTDLHHRDDDDTTVGGYHHHHHHTGSHLGWAHAQDTWSGLPCDGGGPVDLPLAAPDVHPVDPHAAASGVLGHDITAVIAGNVNNGGTQINIIEIDITSAAHTVSA